MTAMVRSAECNAPGTTLMQWEHACQWGRFDPTKPMLKWDTVWRALRDEAGPHGLRFQASRTCPA